MAGEVIVLEERGNNLPVTQGDVDALKRQRSLLAEFVRSQLKEADFSDPKSPSYGEGDYGIIPGTKKRCLFKPGAEKTQKLFGLGCSFQLVDKEVDRQSNFAMYTYKCKVFSLRNPDVTIAECDGSVNSQETKYKERKVWRKKKVQNARGEIKEVSEQITEETPIYDILNTIQKMAQKRAMIGATILATGASDYFSQDVLEPEDFKPQAEPTQQPQTSEPASQEEAPVHTCGKKMMLSKYPNRETGQIDWYCIGCKASIPRAVGGDVS